MRWPGGSRTSRDLTVIWLPSEQVVSYTALSTTVELPAGSANERVRTLLESCVISPGGHAGQSLDLTL